MFHILLLNSFIEMIEFNYQTWGGGSDSYFEYLIKYPRLQSSADPLYADAWRTAVDSSIRTLLKVSTDRLEYLICYMNAKLRLFGPF
jgi:hypothetical protein